MNKLAILVLLAGLVGCMGTTETYDVRYESFDWVVSDTVGSSFIMRDGNQLTQSYRCDFLSNSYDFEVNSGFLMFGKKTVRNQILYMEWNSSYDLMFSMRIEAMPDPYGDAMKVMLNDLSFTYDLGQEEIIGVDTKYGSIEKTALNGSYTSSVPLLSEVEIIDTVSAGSIMYEEGVMHFSLKDFETQWGPYTVTDIYVAKFVGLVKFTLNNGVEFVRL
ncbi:MAG: hypothetical protein R6W67_05485 [Bacteroidales bacterium]